MIDTIKLVIPFDRRPNWVSGTHWPQSLNVTAGTLKLIIDPTPSSKKAGLYLPRLTYYERPGADGRTYSLAIEFSVPKLMFGNNFSEVSETDFNSITNKLSHILCVTFDIYLPADTLAASNIGRVDYSKNIIFADYTPVSTIVSAMRTADISKVYDVQKTDFKNGGNIWHIHTNSLDVAMYDKIADLKQESVSSKRSIETNGHIQLEIVRSLEGKRSISVARFEVRLNSRRKIRNEMEKVGFSGNITFDALFNTSLASNVLLRHWSQVLAKVPKAYLDDETPEQLLLNITKTNPGIKAREALAIMGIRLLSNGKDERYIRNLLEGLFSPSQYKRLKPKSREPPDATQLRTLMRITDILTAMKPVSIDEYY